MKPNLEEYRTEFSSLPLAMEQYQKDMAAHNATMPSHPSIGLYLQANPVEGVSAFEIPGTGIVAKDWPDGMPHPDVDAWLAESEQAAEVARAETEALVRERAAKDEQRTNIVNALRETGDLSEKKPDELGPAVESLRLLVLDLLDRP